MERNKSIFFFIGEMITEITAFYCVSARKIQIYFTSKIDNFSKKSEIDFFQDFVDQMCWQSHNGIETSFDFCNF